MVWIVVVFGGQLLVQAFIFVVCSVLLNNWAKIDDVVVSDVNH